VNWDSRNTRFPYTALVIEKNTPKRILYKYFEIIARNAHFARAPQTFVVVSLFHCRHRIGLLANLVLQCNLLADFIFNNINKLNHGDVEDLI